MAHALPGLRSYRYVDCPPIDCPPIDCPPIDGQHQLFDGMALLEFDSREAHDAALGSEQGQAAMADLPNYADTDAMRPIFGPTVSRKDAF
ncbi:MAG: EthD family reductase [Pseudomonadota bacterium]